MEKLVLPTKEETRPPLLEVEHLAKSFGSLRAVDDVSFRVARNSLTGLIGPNGAGKTTAFGLIAGAIKPDSGKIRLDGQRINGLAPNQNFRLGLARTFQIPRPFPQMTVLENMMLVPMDQSGERFWNNWISPGRVKQEERAARQRALEILDFMNLTEKSGAVAASLSGGQLKLLELGRVLMANPKLILLDEPAAGVNPSLLEVLMEKIEALHRRGLTFLIIEHNMDMIRRLCRPIIVMAQGRRIFEGDPDAVRRDPMIIEAYLGGQ